MQSANFRMPSSDGAEQLEQARSLYNQGLFIECVPYFEGALRAMERSYGDNAPELAQYMEGLGDGYAAAERNSESLIVFDRLFRLGEQILGPNHPQIVQVLWKMSVLAEKLGNLEDSYEMIAQAIQRARQCLRPDEELAIAVVERNAYLGNLLREYNEARRRGDIPDQNAQQSANQEFIQGFVQDNSAPQYMQLDAPQPTLQQAAPQSAPQINLPPAQPEFVQGFVQENLEPEQLERMPFSPSLNMVMGSASMTNMEAMSQESKPLDEAILASNTRAPQQNHLTGSSVLGQRDYTADMGDEGDYRLEDIENLTGRKTPKVVHSGGKARRFSQADNARIQTGRLVKDVLIPVAALAVLVGIIIVAVVPMFNNRPAPAITNKPVKSDFGAGTAGGAGQTVDQILTSTFETGDSERQLRLISDTQAILVTEQGAQLLPLRKVDNNWGAYFEMATSALKEKQIWFTTREGGVEAEDGMFYYGMREPERRVIEKMRYVGGLAQGVYLRSGYYPMFPPVGASQEFQFINPFTGRLFNIPVRQVPGESKGAETLKLVLETGGLVLNEQMTDPGFISCYASVYGDANINRQKASAFFVRGLDRHGKFITSSKPGFALVVQANQDLLNFKPLFTDKQDFESGQPVKKDAAKASGKKHKATRAVVKPHSGSNKQAAQQQLLKPATAQNILEPVNAKPPEKPTTLWLMNNCQVPLSIVHFCLPIAFLVISILTFAMSRLEGVDIKGKSVDNKHSNLPLTLSMITLLAALVTFGIEMALYK